MKKSIKIILSIIVILTVLFIGAGLYAGNYLYNFALTPGADRTAFTEADINQTQEVTSEVDKPTVSEQWLQETGYTEVDMTSNFDGINLHGYRIEQVELTDKWVIVAHGYSSEALAYANSARHFYKMGYNVLMPDARGHGNSEGDYIGMGWHDRLDFVQWSEELVGENPNAQIVFYGISMGGATVMMASGEELPTNVKAIVEDCGYTSVRDIFAYQLKGVFGLPAFPLIDFASLVTKFRAGYTFGEASAVKQVAKSETPMMFIHGTEDTFVPFDMVYDVYDAATVEKKLLTVEGAGHGKSASVMGKEYWTEVSSFLGNYISE